MDIKSLPITCYKGQRVLLTCQIAEIYGYSIDGISSNIRRRRGLFQRGYHFYTLDSQEIGELIGDNPHLRDAFSHAPMMYVWTKEGAKLHSETLAKKSAKSGYEMLERDYFNCKMSATQIFGINNISQSRVEEGDNHDKDDSDIVIPIDSGTTNNSQIPRIFSDKEFGQVRVVAIDGEPYFVGKDVAAALGYVLTRKALRDHVDDADKVRGFQIRTPSGEQAMTLINESGLYSLVLSSKMPNAKNFRKWITSEVLPSIRKTGVYQVSHDIVAPVQSKMSEMLHDIMDKQKTILDEIKELKEAQELLRTALPANSVNADSLSANLRSFVPPKITKVYYTATDIANVFGLLNVDARRVNKALEKLGYIERHLGEWVLTPKGEEYGKYQLCTKGEWVGRIVLWTQPVIDDLLRNLQLC